MGDRIRVLIAKPGLDGHDLGAKYVARGLRDAGMEIIYTGLRQTAEQVVAAALQEDVDVIGCSILCGAHVSIMAKIMKRLREESLEDRLVIVGGSIPKADILALKDMGVAEVFPTNAPLERIVEFIKQSVVR